MKEKIKLSGVPETMLQTVYARAKEIRNAPETPLVPHKNLGRGDDCCDFCLKIQ